MKESNSSLDIAQPRVIDTYNDPVSGALVKVYDNPDADKLVKESTAMNTRIKESFRRAGARSLPDGGYKVHPLPASSWSTMLGSGNRWKNSRKIGPAQ